MRKKQLTSRIRNMANYKSSSFLSVSRFFCIQIKIHYLAPSTVDRESSWKYSISNCRAFTVAHIAWSPCSNFQPQNQRKEGRKIFTTCRLARRLGPPSQTWRRFNKFYLLFEICQLITLGTIHTVTPACYQGWKE